MKLAHVVKSLEEVDSKHHAFYEKKGEEYHLVDSLKKLIKDPKNVEEKIKGYEAILEKVLKEKEELEKKLKEKEEVKEVKDEKKEVKEEKKEVKEDKKGMDEEIKKRFEALEKENKEKQELIEKLNKSNEEKAFDEHLRAIVESENGNYKLLAHHLKSKIKKDVDKVSNEEVYSILDEKGKTRFNGAERVTIKELIQEFKKSDEFKVAFGSKNVGSNSNKVEEKPVVEKPKHSLSDVAQKIRKQYYQPDHARPNNQQLDSIIERAKSNLGLDE